MKSTSQAIRLRIIDILYASNASHLGSNMSMVEILLSIYSMCDIEKIKNKELDRSRVFVSKGHSAAATYAVMEHYELIDTKQLDTYHKNGSIFTGHVNHLVTVSSIQQALLGMESM